MTVVDVLVLHGSPGSGKSTLARAISEDFRASAIAHGVIEMDQLSLTDPFPRAMVRDGELKMIVDTVVADKDELHQLRDAMPGSRIIVCELTAPIDVLKARVTAREPNEFWRTQLRDFVDLHHRRTDLERIRHFLVSTNEKPIAATARDVIEKTRLALTRVERDNQRPLIRRRMVAPCSEPLTRIPMRALTECGTPSRIRDVGAHPVPVPLVDDLGGGHWKHDAVPKGETFGAGE